MGETSVYERIVELFQGPYRVWAVVAVMSILGSLASAFTLCVKRKRADEAISRRKKTDESAPDDSTVMPNDSDRHDDSRLPAASATATTRTHEKRLHNTEVAGENGIHPVINAQVKTANSSSAHQDGEIPSVGDITEKGASEIEGEGEAPEIEAEDAPLIKETAEEGEEGTESEIETEEDAPLIKETDEEGEENVVEEVPEKEEDVTLSEREEEPTHSAPQPLVNGISDVHTTRQREAEVVGGEMMSDALEEGRWNFPPKLEDFDLMKTDIDPSELELTFADERLVEIYLELESDSPGLGISIVGGSGSPSGDLPIIIKRVLPNSLAERDGRLKSGDELVAVNDALLVGVAKDVAIETLSNISGRVRLLVLQDD